MLYMIRVTSAAGYHEETRGDYEAALACLAELLSEYGGVGLILDEAGQMMERRRAGEEESF